jgi:hypothetical protein
MKRRLSPLVTSIGLMALLLFISPPPASAAVSTYTVSSTQGWQDTGIVIPVGGEFRIDYSYGTWTVDYHNFPEVDAGGYPSNMDVSIYQPCKYVSDRPYGYLLGRGGGLGLMRVGNGGTIYRDTVEDVHLSLRINDIDRCLGDNAGSVTVTVTTLTGGVG